MDWAMMAAYFWSLAGFMAVMRSLIPPAFFRYIDDQRRDFVEQWASFYHYVHIRDDHSGFGPNELYQYAHLYVVSLKGTAESVIAEYGGNSTRITFSLASDQRIVDLFQGRRFNWEHRIVEKQEGYHMTEKRSYVLTVLKRDQVLMTEYLRHVIERGKELERQERDKKLFTNNSDGWESVTFVPPSSLDTVAMEPELKELLTKDLRKFMDGKSFYTSVGKAWKRGYLLYGAPGTGKSSLVGAICNFTGYDVYDLELTQVKNNTELKQLLMNVRSRAIVVIEDIDCSLDFSNRSQQKSKKSTTGEENEQQQQEEEVSSEDSKVTLSGLLNFTDGLWSSCGSERLFIFTTNYKDKLDAALLRSGRMDLHIQMSYCKFSIFKVLAKNYLNISEDDMYGEIEELLTLVNITPADVTEILVRYGRDDTSLALSNLILQLKDLIE